VLKIFWVATPLFLSWKFWLDNNKFIFQQEIISPRKVVVWEHGLLHDTLISKRMNGKIHVASEVE
jgi:hypothetical protein